MRSSVSGIAIDAYYSAELVCRCSIGIVFSVGLELMWPSGVRT